MNKQLIQAYFKAYRARINDLEAEVDSLSYSLDEAYSRQESAVSKMRTRISLMEDDLRTREYDQWHIEDKIKDLERTQGRY